MKQVFLDINGDFYNLIFGLEADHNIDKILEEIVEGSAINVKKPKKKATKAKEEKEKKAPKKKANKPVGNGIKRIYKFRVKQKG